MRGTVSTGFGNPLVITLDVGCRRVADIFGGFTLSEFIPRSGYVTQPRVDALRGYPGDQLKKMHNPNGVASRAQIKIAFDSNIAM